MYLQAFLVGFWFDGLLSSPQLSKEFQFESCSCTLPTTSAVASNGTN